MTINIFYSYSHKDEAFKDQLETHLSLLRRQGVIQEWHDRKIAAGNEWADEIDKNLESAQIILLLVSADFLASDYCYDKEMKRGLQKKDAGEARVIPIILRALDNWSASPFGKLQVLPKDAKAVSLWPDPDQAWTDVVRGIREAVDEINASTNVEADRSRSNVEKPLSAFTPEKGWHVPYPKNPYFTGREKILADLQEAIAKTKIAALNGLGGIGKSETAVEYAYRHRQEYRQVLWARADSSESLNSEFAGLAARLNLPEKDAQDQNQAIAAVRSWLASQSDWLLILDNADDLKPALMFLPPAYPGHVLLTTRAQATGAIPRVEIEEMAPDEGALFLLHRSKILAADLLLADAREADRLKAAEIVAALDGLPLALDQAAAYIEETPSSLEEYLELYRAQGKALRAERGELARDHPSVAATFSLAFKRVRENDPAAADIIRVCAFLAADAIPEEIFTEGAAEWAETLGKVAASPLEFQKALREACRYSLLKRNPAARNLDIHRLVQEVVKDEMDEAEQRRWAERVVRAVNRTFPKVEFSNWPDCERWLPHALLCAEHIRCREFEFPESARLLNQIAYFLDERARYAEAEPLYHRSLAIREKALGPEHPDVAEILNNLAALYYVQGRYTDAELLYKHSLAIREQALGPDHPAVSESLNNLAELYRFQGKYKKCEPLYRRSLAIWEKVLGQDHSYVASSLNNLAALYKTQGRYAEAEPLYQRSLGIREQALGPDHPDVAQSLNNLAALYRAQGRYGEADPLHRRSLAIFEKALGPDHPDVATNLNNLAFLYDDQGRYAEAEPLYQRSLAIREQALGPDHPNVAQSLNNLAGLFYGQARYAEAEPLYQRSLAIFEKALGPDHPDLATCLENYADLLRKLDRAAEAEPLETRARSIRSRA